MNHLVCLLPLLLLASTSDVQFMAIRGPTGGNADSFRLFNYSTSANTTATMQSSSVRNRNNVSAIYLGSNTSKVCFIGKYDGSIQLWLRNSTTGRFVYSKRLKNLVGETVTGYYPIYFINASTSASNVTSLTVFSAGVRNTSYNLGVNDTLSMVANETVFSALNQTECANYRANYGNQIYYADGKCQINCSAVANSNGLDDNGDCYCQPNYQWMLYSCQKVADLMAIPSQSGYVWDDGAVSYVPLGCPQCVCDSTTTWTNGGCQNDCVKRVDSMATADPTVCTCADGYNWSKIIDSCICNDSSCSCFSPKYWNSQLEACLMNCSDPKAYSDGTNNSDGTCNCNSNYYRDNVTSLCLARSNPGVGLKLGLGLAIPLGVLAIAGLSVGIYLWARPAPPKPLTAAQKWKMQMMADRNTAYNTPVQYQQGGEPVPQPYVNRE